MGNRAALLAVMLGILGCSAEASDAGARAGGVGGAKTLPALELWGYLRTEATGLATEVTPGPIDFDAIAQSTDRTHALLHVSGFT